MGAELGLTGLVGLTVGGSRLKGELVQIAAPWPVDSSRPRLGSWSSISSRQPVHGQRGGQRGALPPPQRGQPTSTPKPSAWLPSCGEGKGSADCWAQVPETLL